MFIFMIHTDLGVAFEKSPKLIYFQYKFFCNMVIQIIDIQTNPNHVLITPYVRK